MKKLSTLAAGVLGCSLILGMLAATAVRSTALSTSTAETPDVGTVSEALVSQDRALLASAGTVVEEANPASDLPPTNKTPASSAASTSAEGYKQVLQPEEGWKEILDPKMLPEPIAEFTEVILPRSGPIIPGAEFIPAGETKETVNAPSPTNVKEVLNEPNPSNLAGPVVSPASL